MSIDSYAQAAEMCQKRGKPCDSKKIGNNTYIERRDEDFAVRLHNTDILTIRPDNSFVVDTDGWLTVTTKDRLNEHAPHAVHFGSDRGQWQVRFGNWDTPNAHTRPYADGMVIYPSSEGGWTTDPDTEMDKALAEAEVHNKALRKAIAKYVKDFRFPQTQREIFDLGGIDTGGDCWDCGMVLENGQTMGDFTESDHLTNHMKEGYYVPSLVLNAVKARGVPDPAGYIAIMMDRAPEGEKPGLGNVGRDVKAYMSQRLLVGVAPAHGGQMVHGDVLKWYRDRHETPRQAADFAPSGPDIETAKAHLHGQEVTVGRIRAR